MPTRALHMRKIRDLIRLKYEARLSHEQIAGALAISKGVVAKYVSSPGTDQSTQMQANTSDVLGDIYVTSSRKGERNWQGNNPNPTKGAKPKRDANGNPIGWILPTPDGKGKEKSLEWGRQNGLDPKDFQFGSNPVTWAWLLSLMALFSQFDAYTTAPL